MEKPSQLMRGLIKFFFGRKKNVGRQELTIHRIPMPSDGWGTFSGNIWSWKNERANMDESIAKYGKVVCSWCEAKGEVMK